MGWEGKGRGGRPWRRIRDRVLRRDLYLCQACLKEDRTTSATEIHHIIGVAEGGSDDDANLLSLCGPCHAKIEGRKKGWKPRPDFDARGFPIWPDEATRWGYSIPHGVKPSAIPVTLVCGPPGAGKSYYVDQHKAEGDTVIDLDLFCCQVGGKMWDTSKDILSKAFKARDEAIHSLQFKTDGRCFLIVTAPTAAERRAWQSALKRVEAVVIKTPQDECIARIKANPDRKAAAAKQIAAVQRWWAEAD